MIVNLLLQFRMVTLLNFRDSEPTSFIRRVRGIPDSLSSKLSRLFLAVRASRYY